MFKKNMLNFKKFLVGFTNIFSPKKSFEGRKKDRMSIKMEKVNLEI